MITAGKVCVNGKVVTQLGTKADPDTCQITVSGSPITLTTELVYLLLNKPEGYASTRSDPHAHHTVMELLRGIDSYLYPVGRLDVDTSGLLLLSNDGDLTHQLTHPSHEVDKTYTAVVTGRVASTDLSKLERGIELEDGVTAPAAVRLISYSPGTNISTLEITIHEGRKRQVKRMLTAVGHECLRLKRVKFGNLDLKGVEEGHWRQLTKKEVAELRKLAKGTRGRGVR